MVLGKLPHGIRSLPLRLGFLLLKRSRRPLLVSPPFLALSWQQQDDQSNGEQGE